MIKKMILSLAGAGVAVVLTAGPVFGAAPASPKCALSLDTANSSTVISIGRRTTPPPATTLIFNVTTCARNAVFKARLLPKSEAGPQLDPQSVTVTTDRKATDTLVVQMKAKLRSPGIDAGTYSAVLVITGPRVSTTKLLVSVTRSDSNSTSAIAAGVVGGLIAVIIAGAQVLYGSKAAAAGKNLSVYGWIAVGVASLIAAAVATVLTLNSLYFADSVVFRGQSSDLMTLALKSGAASLASATTVITVVAGMTFATKTAQETIKKRRAAKHSGVV